MRSRLAALFVAAAGIVVAAVAGPSVRPVTGRVVDAKTRAPITGAIVTDSTREFRTDERGAFRVDAAEGSVGVRAYGYERKQVAVATLSGDDPVVPLAAFHPKALYLSMYGIGSSALRGAALRIADATEVNAVVVDIKGDRGYIAYRTTNPVAAQVGAQKIITIRDLPALVTSLHGRGLYSIARIVVFKDDLLATGRPDLAVRTRAGLLYRDRERLAWTDPFNRDVWAYNVAVAVDAAKAGFDEVQFDYVRLPDAQGLPVRDAQTQASRRAAIAGFLGAARAATRPYNVFLAADIFGYVCWNTDDTGIGQRLDSLVDVVDYLSPMLYPSSFQFGIPGYPNPVAAPYAIVRLSLKEALDRTHVPPARFRPWLQAFPDYAFHGGAFRNGEVRLQIKAADDVGTNGWMLWNPRNQYSAADLGP